MKFDKSITEYAVLWDDGEISHASTDRKMVVELINSMNIDGLVICKLVSRRVSKWRNVPRGTF